MLYNYDEGCIFTCGMQVYMWHFSWPAGRESEKDCVMPPLSLLFPHYCECFIRRELAKLSVSFIPRGATMLGFDMKAAKKVQAVSCFSL